MPKLQRLEIVLDNPQIIYFPGQVIQGRLIVELREDMKMRGIRVKCRGKAYVSWSSGSGKNRRSYSAVEEYMDEVLILYGNSPSSNSDVTLSAGNHVYPFQFIIPLNVPGSFEGRGTGFVRYWLKGIIERPWKFDPQYKLMFSVGSVLDLNTVPNASIPAQANDAKTVCCCCCESPPIRATIRVDRNGYVPGENIICNAEITDGTGRGVSSSKILLMMQTTHRTHGGSRRRFTDNITFLRHGPINPGGSDVWSSEAILIPPLPPSVLPYCSIIEIEYFVQLSVDVVNTPIDLTLRLPIVIGTIPLQAVVNQYRPVIQPGTITHQPLGFQSPVNFDLPPPTYQECVLGKVDTTDDDDKNAAGNMNFAPAYTYYDWMNHPTPSATS